MKNQRQQKEASLEKIKEQNNYLDEEEQNNYLFEKE